MKKILLTAILIAISLDCIAAVGQITEMSQTPAVIQRDKATLTGITGTGVEMADVVNTKHGKVGIVFEDDTKVQVSENSKLVIDDFVYDPKGKKPNRLALNMASGTVRYASGIIAHSNPNAVNLRTPTATIAVRGTDFTTTVAELGESTIILLPSCPTANPVDYEVECKTGKIEVITDVGSVTLDKPFQATKVLSANTFPLKPVILRINENAISNMLIISPPSQIKLAQERAERETKLGNANSLLVTTTKLDTEKTATETSNPIADWTIDIEHPVIASVAVKTAVIKAESTTPSVFLDNEILNIILDMVSVQINTTPTSNNNSLTNTPIKNIIIPDYTSGSGAVATVDAQQVEICRTDFSNNTVCAITPRDQNSTIIQTQGAVTVVNRINQGGNTVITTRQN
jgi:FecR protein